MSSFRDKIGDLTVAQAQELNRAAAWYGGYEVISECEES